jgi:hypothetical protein
MAWKAAAAKTLLPVLLNSHTMRTRAATVPSDHQAIHTGNRCTCSNSTKCQMAHTDPRRMLAGSAPHRSCIGSMAYPDQPNSSPSAARNSASDMPTVATTGICGIGSATPIQRISPYCKTARPGVKRRIGAYQIFSLILLKSKDLFSSSLTPAILLSRQTKMTAAVVGQKATISAVTGTPGNSWNVVKAPVKKNGRERANTNKKNFGGDLRRGGTVFTEFSGAAALWKQDSFLVRGSSRSVICLNQDDRLVKPLSACQDRAAAGESRRLQNATESLRQNGTIVRDVMLSLPTALDFSRYIKLSLYKDRRHNDAHRSNPTLDERCVDSLGLKRKRVPARLAFPEPNCRNL